MPARPWVRPADVTAYSEYKSVKERSEAKLVVDILRAENYVISYTNNTFEDLEEIPESVKTATIIVAEAYGYNACLAAREMKSEQFDDYSYTAADASPIDIGSLDLGPLLDEYTKTAPRNGVTLRMRKL